MLNIVTLAFLTLFVVANSSSVQKA